MEKLLPDYKTALEKVRLHSRALGSLVSCSPYSCHNSYTVQLYPRNAQMPSRVSCRHVHVPLRGLSRAQHDKVMPRTCMPSKPVPPDHQTSTKGTPGDWQSDLPRVWPSPMSRESRARTHSRQPTVLIHPHAATKAAGTHVLIRRFIQRPERAYAMAHDTRTPRRAPSACWELHIQ